MAAYISKEKPFSKKWFKAYAFILLGSVILTFGYVYFIIPYKILPGGIYGISIILHHQLGLPVGVTALVFNMILLGVGLKILGPRFGVKTFTTLVLIAVLVDVGGYFTGYEPLVEDDALLSAVFGGLLVGLGVGLIFRARASTGGSDVLAMIIGRFSSMPVGQIMIIVDSLVVLLGLVVFGDWRIPLYSWILIFVYGKIVDVVLQGPNYDKTLFIISKKHKEIQQKLVHEMGRRGSFITGEGMFGGKHHKIIFTTVTRREVAILQDFIHDIDPDAFMTVLEANEVLGGGFKTLKDKLDK